MPYLKNDREICELLGRIAAALPDEPAAIWAKDGDEILCESGLVCDGIADLFDAIYGEPTVNTGYYDPDEDERNGETDERTGYYYVTTF